eukprot:Gb_29580 [translate_table: standard]
MSSLIIAYLNIIVSIFLSVYTLVAATDDDDRRLRRNDFPSDFTFGLASSASAYQYEGAYLEDGKGLSNWDWFSHIPGTIADGKNADVTVDEYHLYNEDVKLMFEIGVDSYRFSIAWARIFPEGRGKINPAGVKYYNDLIDSLLSRGIRIQPFVTLCHFDIPQALEDQYGDWLNPNIAEDFAQYAETCFRIFGDRVKYWITFNEPNVFIPLGYDTGIYPPKRCSPPFGNCSAGDSTTEPYIAAHNLLRAHASAVDIYRRLYQHSQNGLIGITITTLWYEPLRFSVSEDLNAVNRLLDFQLTWFLDPIVFGEYPAIMLKLVGTRLPSITEDFYHKLLGSYDFIGLNYYSTLYATDASYYLNSSNRDYRRDSLSICTGERNGVPIGPQMATTSMYGVPYGVKKIVEYIKTRYSNPPMYITENGFGDLRDDSLPLPQILNDTFRVDYIESILKYLAETRREGADVRGYFLWSLLDDFEWKYGYTAKFGIYHVDFKGDNKNRPRRYPKLSAGWYRNFLKGKTESNYEIEFPKQVHSFSTRNG